MSYRSTVVEVSNLTTPNLEFRAFVAFFTFFILVVAAPYSISLGNEAKKCQENNGNVACKKYVYYYWGYYVCGIIGYILYGILLIFLLWWGAEAAHKAFRR
jgi:hypothetical protein